MHRYSTGDKVVIINPKRSSYGQVFVISDATGNIVTVNPIGSQLHFWKHEAAPVDSPEALVLLVMAQ